MTAGGAENMSASFPIFDAIVEQLIGWIGPVNALDLGPGAGKHGRLIARAAPSCRLVAVERQASYVEQFALAQLYHRVEVADANEWLQGRTDEEFDLLIAGDLLQHLTKSEGLDLLNAAVYRTSWVIVIMPEFVRQGAIDGLSSAVHRSVWSERDLHWHDLWAWDNARSSTLIVMRGYRPSALTIDELVHRVNGGNLPLLDYDAQSIVRPCRMRLIDYSREVAYRPR